LRRITIYLNILIHDLKKRLDGRG